jgi:1-aminocyclopropane-1-carboxylate deaminase/D-cysteine desulfhydrase-like pyridoxal-dependent ACC family enzyme
VATAVELAVALVREHDAFFIPPGATMPESVPGYAASVAEIAEQCDDTWPFDIVVTAHGTGSTAAGLWAGLALCGIACRVVTVAVARRDALERFGTPHPRVLGEQAWTHFGLPGAPSPSTACDWVLGYGEAGYAVPSADADAALRRLAHDDGYLLDPVYTARAFAGLEHEVARGEIPAAARVLFIHTGGLTTTPLADKRKDTST